MKTAATVLVVTLIILLPWVLCAAPAEPAATQPAAVRPLIDASKYFDPSSPTSGLQDAIEATGPEGGIVMLPPGVYRLRRSLVIKGRVTLRGSGASTVLRKAAGFASPLTADLPAGATEIEVKDGSGFRVGGEIGIRDPERNGWHCHHPIVKAVKGNRVTFEKPTVRDYKVERGALAFSFHPAIYAKDQSDFSIENLRIDGNPAAQPAGVPVDFTFAAVHLVKCSRARVRDVWVTGWPSDGIGVLGDAYDEWNVCSGNTCTANGRAGIHMSNGKNNTVTGNVCVNNSKSEAGKYPGILLRNTSGSLVAANRCGDDQKKPTQLLGISETGKSDSNLISNNHLSGSGKGLETVGPHTQATGNLE